LHNPGYIFSSFLVKNRFEAALGIKGVQLITKTPVCIFYFKDTLALVFALLLYKIKNAQGGDF